MINTLPEDYDIYDKTIRVGSMNGFVRSRRFTDLFCCLSYLLIVFACVGIGIVNRGQGGVGLNKLTDSSRNVCSGKNKYLYFPTEALDRSVCVQSCPSRAGVRLQCLKNK